MSEWEGLEGSLAKFGRSVGFVRFANVPYSEEKVCVGFSFESISNWVLSTFFNIIL